MAKKKDTKTTKVLVFSLIPLKDSEGNVWRPAQFFLMSEKQAEAFLKKGFGVSSEEANYLTTVSKVKANDAPVKAPSSTSFEASYLGHF